MEKISEVELLSEVALTYLKYSSAIEIARSDFEGWLKELLDQTKKKITWDESGELSGWVGINSYPYSFWMRYFKEKIGIGIEVDGKNHKSQFEKEIGKKIRGLKRKGGNNYTFGYKEYTIEQFKKQFEGEIDKFVKVFKALTKKGK